MLRATNQNLKKAQEQAKESGSLEETRTKERQQSQQQQDAEDARLAREREEATEAERRRKQKEQVALAANQERKRYSFHRGADARAEDKGKDFSSRRLDALWKWPGIKQVKALVNANSDALRMANNKSSTQETGVELWFSQLSAVALGVLACFVVAISFAVMRRRKVRHEDLVPSDTELADAMVESTMPAANVTSVSTHSAATATTPVSPVPPPREPRSLHAGTPTTMRRFRVSPCCPALPHHNTCSC